MIIHADNQIHIAFGGENTKNTIFRYRGYFEITRAMINDNGVDFENNNLDYWDKDNSKWDEDDTRNWEEMGNTYRFKVGIKNRKNIFKTGKNYGISKSKTTSVSY